LAAAFAASCVSRRQCRFEALPFKGRVWVGMVLILLS
jgi:hypothetical protein